MTKIRAGQINSESATNGQVLTANGTSGTSWSTPSVGGGGGGNLIIYDDSVYKTTGTAISFDGNLSVAVTGSIAFVSASSGGSASGLGVMAWDEGVPLGTGTVFNFRGDSIVATISGSVVDVYVNATGSSTTYTWSTGTFTDGCDQNRNTGATNLTAFIGGIFMYQPLKVTQILWDIRTSGTYTLAEVYGPNGGVTRTLVASQAAGVGEITFNMPANTIFTPGWHWLKLSRDSGTSGFQDYNVADFSCSLFLLQKAYWLPGLNVTSNALVLPIKLVAYTGV